jgi:hypothetical protein
MFMRIESFVSNQSDSLDDCILFICHSIHSGSYCYSIGIRLSFLWLSWKRSIQVYSVRIKLRIIKNHHPWSCYCFALFFNFLQISNADSGALFVFGTTYQEHFFVFKVNLITIHLSSIMHSIVHRLGDLDHHLSWFCHQCTLLSRCHAIHHR